MKVTGLTHFEKSAARTGAKWKPHGTPKVQQRSNIYIYI